MFIDFFDNPYTPDEMARIIRNSPPDRWPAVTEIADVMQNASRDQKRMTFKRVFEAFSARSHRKLSDEEQAAIWKTWQEYGTDAFSVTVKERYVLQRLNNEAMWVTEDLRKKIAEKHAEYQSECKKFFEEKNREWRTVPTRALEDWLTDTRKQFKQMIMEL